MKRSVTNDDRTRLLGDLSMLYGYLTASLLGLPQEKVDRIHAAFADANDIIDALLSEISFWRSFTPNERNAVQWLLDRDVCVLKTGMQETLPDAPLDIDMADGIDVDELLEKIFEEHEKGVNK